tara:strand:+ start:365 stop:514 length:150 start_codon:yes stop_codon:yes gene_type:complete
MIPAVPRGTRFVKDAFPRGPAVAVKSSFIGTDMSTIPKGVFVGPEPVIE